MAVRNESDAPKDLRVRAFVFVLSVLLGIGIFQNFALVNLQLLWKAPELVPQFKFGDLPFNLFLIFGACAFLIVRFKDFFTPEWRIAFVVLLIPYLFLKGVGVYWDVTVYLIAAARNQHIGGGAAFGHLFLGFFILGPAQILSALVFFLVRRCRRDMQSPRNTHKPTI